MPATCWEPDDNLLRPWTQVEAGQQARQQAAHLTAQAAELGAVLATARRERDSAKGALILASHSAPHTTANELQVHPAPPARLITALTGE